MEFNFPRIKDLQSSKVQISKIVDELNELRVELDKRDIDKSTIELIDVLHATESLVRIFMEQFSIPLSQIDLFIQRVKSKNQNRGYYS
jgi:hypothetical protein